MAGPAGGFIIADRLGSTASHHESFQQLWETKWKKPCSMGVYPFMFGAIQDFEPIVARLIKEGQKEPYDWDAYAQAFLPKAQELVDRAKQAESNNHIEETSELYLRASAIYRIARFPKPRSPLQHHAWTAGKAACLRGLQLQPYPMSEEPIPHTHGDPTLDGPTIPVYSHQPSSATPTSPCPAVIIYTGLDGYRTDLAVWTAGWAALGVAVLILEIPGTGDSPAAPADPASADRQFSSLLAWIDGQPCLDRERLVLWGFSTGGYYALRAAHTHPDRCLGFVALGGGCHYMFEPAWLDATLRLEYPFDLATTLAEKFGYGGGAEGYEQFKAEAKGRFSLLEDGTLDRECGRLLLVNGVEDEIFPIDDYYLALTRGRPKEARFVDGRKHMGEPESFVVILKWIYALLGIEADPGEQLRTIPFKAKYP